MPPLDPSKRLYSCDVAIFRIASAPLPTAAEGGLTYKDLAGIYQDSTLRFTREHVNAMLPRDVMDSDIQGFIQNRTKRKQWFLDLGTVLEKTDNPVFLLKMALTPGTGIANSFEYEAYRGLVKVHLFRPGGTGLNANPGSTYSGFAYITEARFTVSSESVILQNATLTGVGPLNEASTFTLP